MTSFARDPLWLLWNEGNFDTDLLYNSCLNSLQAKKWCSSLSSLHIDEELASLMPPKNWFRPFSPSSMQLSKLSWQSSSSTHANYQLPEETISPDPHQPSFNETFFCSLLQFSNYLTSSSSINAAWHFFHILRSQSSLLLHWKTVQISCHTIPAAL